MNKRQMALAIIAVAVGVLSLPACGSDRTPLTTAPTVEALPSSALAVPFEEAISGSQWSTHQSGTTETAQLTVTSLVAGTSCPTLAFMINNYVIKTSASTAYSGGACADIKAGTKLGLMGTLSNETQLAFNATRVTMQSTTTNPVPDGRPVETEGTVTGVVGGTSCPVLQFTLSGWSGYTFKTTSSTQVSGGNCADIKTGAKIAVVGSKLEGVATLSAVTFKHSGKEPATAVSGDTEVTSVDSATSCPTLTFRLGTYSITTSAATVYEGGTCASIKAGAKIRLTGMKSELTIQATKIQFKGTDRGTPTFDKVEGEGVISSVSSGTACPALTFMIGTYAITVDAATTFDSGACADLKAGLRVHVKGSTNSGGGVNATRITIQHEAPHPEAEGEGVVTGMVAGAACPALRFMIGEYTVVAGAATQFPTGSCSEIAVGTKVNVKGAQTDVKTVTAARIIVKH